MNMRIGIDIDDTLTNTTELAKKLRNVEFPNYKDKDMIPKDLFVSFLNKNKYKLYREVEAKEYAYEALYELKKLGFTIYLITYRENDEETINNTITNLKDNKIIYDDIYFGAKNKGIIGNELKLDLLIDDRMDNCNQAFDYGINIIKFKRNDEIQDKFIEFDNWKDIIEYIKEEFCGKNSN